MASGRRGGSIISRPEFADDRPDRGDQPGPAVAQLEQALVRGGGDFLDIGKALPVEKLVAPHAAGAAQQRRGNHIQRRAALRDTMQVPAGDSPGGNQPAEFLSQRALAYDMKRPGWRRTEHQHASERLRIRPGRRRQLMTPGQPGHDSPQLLFRRPGLGQIGTTRQLMSCLSGDLSRQPIRVPSGTVHGMRAIHQGITILTSMMPAGRRGLGTLPSVGGSGDCSERPFVPQTAGRSPNKS